MDYQEILSQYQCKTCIMSVEMFPDGTYGNVRVVDGNEAHAADVEAITGHKFMP